MQSTRNHTRRIGLGRTGTALLLGLALCVTSIGANPGDDDRFGTIGDPNGEEVGTLPATIGSPSFWLPALTFTGTQADVQKLVARVDGLDPAAGVSKLADGRTRFVFYGAVDVSLDRDLLAQGNVDVSLQVGMLFAGGVSQLRWNGEANPMQVLPADGDVRLGLGLIAQSPEAAQAQLKLVNLRRNSSTVDIQAVGDRVQIVVQHPQ